MSDLLLLVAEWAGYSVSSTAGPATLVVEGERVPFSIVEEIGRTLRAKRPAQQRNRSSQKMTRTLELTEFVQSDNPWPACPNFEDGLCRASNLAKVA